jgi:hypothetical protein
MERGKLIANQPYAELVAGNPSFQQLLENE